MESLAQVGVQLLLFTLGLEFRQATQMRAVPASACRPQAKLMLSWGMQS